ncbi:MAG: SET domain-containing protein [Candidatus Falkowbacteria bacterium]|nr:MAG: SET domain-containing protein [Candidatus Falkowbacteria bacterium]
MKKTKKTPHADAYTRLGISKIQGIGVFAIRDIPNNKKIFEGETSKLIWFSKKKVDKLEPALRKLYEDFCILEGDKYGAPDNFNNISIGWFLNHNSKNPNVRCNRNCDYVSTKKIKAGEELSVDYSSFADNHHFLTKATVKSKNK